MQQGFSPISTAGAEAKAPLSNTGILPQVSFSLRHAGIVGLVCFLSITCAPTSLKAQLRPYEPTEWAIFDEDTRVVGSIGGSYYGGQRAALAGEIGTLKEIGLFSAFVRSSRIAVGLEGTLQRRFERSETFADPQLGTEPDEDGSRQDAGDYRVSTIVRLTPDSARGLAVLRFGTRLPTTDNTVGLERDQMDFYATIGGRYDLGAVRTAAEVGLGIHSTRDLVYEQSDVVIYQLSVGLPHGVVAPSLILAGHADALPDQSIPGNEELAEVRFRLRAGRDFWVQAEAIAGLMEYSPGRGVSIMVGATL